MESFLTIVRSKTSTFRLFEVTFLLEKWKLVCLIYTFRVPRRSKSGWRKQDSVLLKDLVHIRQFKIGRGRLILINVNSTYISAMTATYLFQ